MSTCDVLAMIELLQPYWTAWFSTFLQKICHLKTISRKYWRIMWKNVFCHTCRNVFSGDCAWIVVPVLRGYLLYNLGYKVLIYFKNPWLLKICKACHIVNTDFEHYINSLSRVRWFLLKWHYFHFKKLSASVLCSLVNKCM